MISELFLLNSELSERNCFDAKDLIVSQKANCSIICAIFSYKKDEKTLKTCGFYGSVPCNLFAAINEKRLNFFGFLRISRVNDTRCLGNAFSALDIVL